MNGFDIVLVIAIILFAELGVRLVMGYIKMKKKTSDNTIVLVVIGILIAENLAPTLKPACRTGRGGFSGFELLNIILV